MAPKVAGAWNLHEATTHEPLDFFVLFSSAASVLGSPGQGSYAAPPQEPLLLDRFGASPPVAGLAGALSVNWGAWADTGNGSPGGSTGPSGQRTARHSADERRSVPGWARAGG